MHRSIYMGISLKRVDNSGRKNQILHVADAWATKKETTNMPLFEDILSDIGNGKSPSLIDIIRATIEDVNLLPSNSEKNHIHLT